MDISGGFNNSIPEEDKADIAAAAKNYDPSDIALMQTLPVKKVRVAGIEFSARYDEKSGALYVLDEKGIPTGEVKVLNKKLPDRLPVKKPEKKSNANPLKNITSCLGSLASKPSKGNEESPNKGSASSGISPKKALIACGCAVLALALIVGVMGAASKLSKKEEAPSADKQRVNVIKINQSVIPGTIITESMIEEVRITNETFNQYTLNGQTVYTWENAPSVIGMYAISYIQSGQYLTTSSISGTKKSYDNIFKHLTSEGNAYLEIPVNISYDKLADVIIGRHVELKLQRDTISGKDQKIETSNVDGLDHTSAITERTITDIYKFKDAVILDLINLNGDSMYEVMSQYNAIPDGDLQNYLAENLAPRVRDNFAVGNKDFTTILPEFCVSKLIIELPAEQVKAIGNLDPALTTLTIVKLGDEYVADTAMEIEYVSQTKFTAGVLKDAFSKIR